MPKYKIDEELRTFLKQKRKECGYTNEKLAKKVAMTKSTYNNYENGKNKNITLDSLWKILKKCYEKLEGKEDIEDTEETADNDENFNNYIKQSLFDSCIYIYSKEKLQEMLWCQALCLMLDADLVSNSYAREAVLMKINNLYGNTNGNIDWEKLFATLNQNPWLKQSNLDGDDKQIYMKPLTKIERDAGYVNVFQINYNLTDADIKSKSEDAKQAKIRICDLFMLIFNAEMRVDKDEQKAYKRTCEFFHYAGIPLVYNQLGFFNYPETKPLGNLAEIEAVNKFEQGLLDFLDNGEYETQNPIIKMFKENYTASGLRFLKVIAVDFKFINEISGAFDDRLQKQIKDTVLKFKREI